MALTALGRSFQVLHHGVIVDPAQDLLLHQAELLSRGQLPLTGEAGEARQVVSVAPGAPHPVAGVYLPPAAGALSTKPTARERRRRAEAEEETRGERERHRKRGESVRRRRGLRQHCNGDNRVLNLISRLFSDGVFLLGGIF